MQEVHKGHRRDLDDMLTVEECRHDRIYIGPKDYWYCADCPEWAGYRDWFKSTTTSAKKMRKCDP